MFNNKNIETQAKNLHGHLFNSLIKKVALGVAVLGLVTPVVSRVFNVNNNIYPTTVNARRRHRHRHVSYDWRLATRLHDMSMSDFSDYLSDAYFLDGLSDGNVDNHADGGFYTANLNMNNVSDNDYDLGWLYSHSNDYSAGYSDPDHTTRGYYNSIKLLQQGINYGNNTGDEYLYYNSGASDTGYDPNTNDITDTGDWESTDSDNMSQHENSSYSSSDLEMTPMSYSNISDYDG